MQVILKADVDHLGFAMDVVDVKRGYWRNYLRPRGLAETATAERVAELSTRMERRRSAEARNEEEATELKHLLDRTLLTIPAHAGPQGKLYGSVTAADIAREVEKVRKMRLDAKKIKLDEPIKALGTFMVPVEVYAGVTAEMKTMVVQSSATEEELARIAAGIEAAELAAVEAADAAEAAAAKAASDAEAAAAGEADADAAAEGDAAPAEADAAVEA